MTRSAVCLFVVVTSFLLASLVMQIVEAQNSTDGTTAATANSTATTASTQVDVNATTASTATSNTNAATTASTAASANSTATTTTTQSENATATASTAANTNGATAAGNSSTETTQAATGTTASTAANTNGATTPAGTGSTASTQAATGTAASTAANTNGATTDAGTGSTVATQAATGTTASTAANTNGATSSAAATGSTAQAATSTAAAATTTTTTPTTTTTTNYYQRRCAASTTSLYIATNETFVPRPCTLPDSNSCGNSNEYCMPMTAFDSVFSKTMTCLKGICMPVISTTTSTTSTTSLTTSTETTTSTTTTSTTTTPGTTTTTTAFEGYPRKYGRPCSQDYDCYTGYCVIAAGSSTGTCGCATCAQYVISWDLNMQSNPISFVYSESCIPATSAIVSAGQQCGSYLMDPPSSECDSTSMCMKCPENWGNAASPGICQAIKFPAASTSSTVTCPCSNGNGYLATCNVVAGMPICTCPAGYKLHANGKDCYGWKTTSVSPTCSTTCNDGVQSITQTCDAPDALNSPCETSLKKTTQTCNLARCPYDAEAQQYAIDVCFTSTLLTIALFNSVVAPALQDNVATAMNSKCKVESTTFVSCCPGKTWSADLYGAYIDAGGVYTLNPYKADSQFCFGLMLKPNATNPLCSNASSTATTPATSGRKKRDAFFAPVDQASLLQLAQSPAFVASLNGAIQKVDSSAAVAASSFARATTTTTTTVATNSSGQTTYYPSSQTVYDETWINIGGTWIQVWVLGVAIGGGVLLIIIIIIVIVCCKKKQNQQSKVGTYNGAGSRPPSRNTPGYSPQYNPDEDNKTKSAINYNQQQQSPSYGYSSRLAAPKSGMTNIYNQQSYGNNNLEHDKAAASDYYNYLNQQSQYGQQPSHPAVGVRASNASYGYGGAAQQQPLAQQPSINSYAGSNSNSYGYSQTGYGPSATGYNNSQYPAY